MIHPDLFVGIVAVALSIFVLVAAILDWDGVYALRAPKMIEARWGRGKARIAVMLVGVILLAIGIYLLYGLAGKSESNARQSKVGTQTLELKTTLQAFPF